MDQLLAEGLIIGRQGVGVAMFLESVRVRPVFARVASDNAGSLKVLQKAGFAITGTEISFANGRNAEIEETILRLEEPANSAPFDASSGEKRAYSSRQ